MANNVTPNIVYLFNYETQETSAKPIIYRPTHLYTRSQAVARIAAGCILPHWQTVEIIAIVAE